MNKKVFISYSRKDTLDIAEFKTIKKFRDFEIVIDDEEVPFNQLWKDNIRQKINDSDAAIFFISKNALNPESPIRSLEIPLISKRLRDPDEDFNFFPIFLEDVEKELDSYTFTTLKDAKEVKFLDFFQIYDIEKQNTLENLSSRMRKRFFRNINANISQVLKGGTLSPGQELITKLSRIQKIRWALGVLSVVLGLGWFTTTDAYARILIAAYEQRIESGEVAADSATVRFLADQLDSVENLDSLTNDESLKESIAEVAELNLNLNLDDDLQNIDLSGTVEDSTTTTLGTTTTTLGTTTTTLGTTTTTLGTTTTTLGTTNSVDTDAPTFNKNLTAENITSSTVDISWSATDNVGVSYYVLREGSFVIYEGSNTLKEVEGLVSSKAYTFSVDAYDGAGNFSTSNVSFTTLSGPTSSNTTTTSTTTTTLPDSDTQGPTVNSSSIQEAYTSGGNYFWGSYDNEISLTGGDATIRMSISTSDDYSNVDLNNSTIFIVDSSGNNVSTNPSSAILDSCRPGLWCAITIPSDTSTGNYIIRANLIDTAPTPNTRVVDISNFNIIKPVDTQAPTLTSLTMYEWDGNTWNSFDSYLNTTGGDGSIKAIITADDDLSNLDLNASTAFIEYPDGTLGQSNILDYCRTGANGCAFTIPRSIGEGEFKLKATFVDTASPANSNTVELYSFTVTCLGCTTTTTTTTTTVPVENPHLENSLIWWVNDTDICFYTEVDASSGTIKWKVYINDVLQFENQGPAGQSTHFTHLKTSAGSSGDSLTLRVEVYDGDGTLYENTTFATTTLGSGSSYYQNITDVGNECPIGKTP